MHRLLKTRGGAVGRSGHELSRRNIPFTLNTLQLLTRSKSRAQR